MKSRNQHRHFQCCVLGGSFKPCLHTWLKFHLTNLLHLTCSELQPLPMKGQAILRLLRGFPCDTFTPYLKCCSDIPCILVSKLLADEVFWFRVQDGSLACMWTASFWWSRPELLPCKRCQSQTPSQMHFGIGHLKDITGIGYLVTSTFWILSVGFPIWNLILHFSQELPFSLWPFHSQSTITCLGQILKEEICLFPAHLKAWAKQRHDSIPSTLKHNHVIQSTLISVLWLSWQIFLTPETRMARDWKKNKNIILQMGKLRQRRTAWSHTGRPWQSQE